MLTAAASRRVISSRRRPATSNASPPRRAAIGVEQNMHWLLDVEFKDDLSASARHGAKNMATIRRLRANKSKGSVKSRRKAVGLAPQNLLQILQLK